MDPSDLTEKSELNRTWAKLTLDAFEKPDMHMQRLWDMAGRDTWTTAEMDWDSIDLTPIPLVMRQKAANMLSQLHYGEVTAMLSAARLVQQAPSLSAQLFSSTQVNDEARHVQWFSNLMQKLGCDGQVQDCVVEFMNEVYECESIDGLIVGMHILVEGMAHSFFMEGSRMFDQAGMLTKMSKPYKAANKVIGEWLPNFLGRDESRHIAYGVHYLNQRLPQLSTRERDKLEERVNHWGQLFVSAALDPKLVLVPGMSGVQVADRCIKDLNHRLASIGLYARIPEVKQNWKQGAICAENF